MSFFIEFLWLAYFLCKFLLNPFGKWNIKKFFVWWTQNFSNCGFKFPYPERKLSYYYLLWYIII